MYLYALNLFRIATEFRLFDIIPESLTKIYSCKIKIVQNKNKNSRFNNVKSFIFFCLFGFLFKI